MKPEDVEFSDKWVILKGKGPFTHKGHEMKPILQLNGYSFIRRNVAMTKDEWGTKEIEVAVDSTTTPQSNEPVIKKTRKHVKSTGE